MLALELITITLATLAIARVAPRTSPLQLDIVMRGALDDQPLERRCNQPGGTWVCVS
jgi:hypothetical protein